MPALRKQSELVVAERRARVFELARVGYDPRDIAAMCNISVAQVRADVDAELSDVRAVTAENAAVQREMELARLARMTASLYPLCISRKVVRKSADGSEYEDVVPPSEKAIYAMLAVMDRRARYLGLDSPDTSISVQIPYERCTNEQLARIAAGADLREILAEIEAGKGRPLLTEGNAGKPTINVTPTGVPTREEAVLEPVEIVVDADHPLASGAKRASRAIPPPVKAAKKRTAPKPPPISSTSRRPRAITATVSQHTRARARR